MITLRGERHAMIASGSNGDTVITAFDLPAESVLKKVKCNLNVISGSAAFERDEALNWAVAMYLIPLDDPDTIDTYDDLWDRFVPKYTDVNAIEFDTGVAGVDTTPFWEPGEADFETLFDMGQLPLRMFMRRRRWSFADPGNAGLRFQPSETPFEPKWMGAENVTIQTNKPIHIKEPTVCLIAIAAAGSDDTTSSRQHLNEAEWGQIQYVEATLERSLIHQLNLVEGGAETPWEESSILLRKHLAPDMFEQVAASYLTSVYNVFCDMQFEHTVPGQMDFGVIDLTP